MMEHPVASLSRAYPCGCELAWYRGEMTAQPCSEAHAITLEALLAQFNAGATV